MNKDYFFNPVSLSFMYQHHFPFSYHFIRVPVHFHKTDIIIISYCLFYDIDHRLLPHFYLPVFKQKSRKKRIASYLFISSVHHRVHQVQSTMHFKGYITICYTLLVFYRHTALDHNLRFPLINGDTHTDGSLPVFQQRLSLDVKQHTECTTSFFNSHTSCIFSGTKLNRIVPNQTMQNIENQRKQN